MTTSAMRGIIATRKFFVNCEAEGFNNVKAHFVVVLAGATGMVAIAVWKRVAKVGGYACL